MYRERVSQVTGAVVWTRTESTVGDIRVLPDGCMDLIWGTTGELFVAGADTEAHVHVTRPGRTLTGIRFAPGLGPAVLGIPAHALLNLRLPLAEIVGPSEAGRLTDRLAASTAPGRTLEAIATERLVQPPDHRIGREVVRLLRAGHTIRDVAGTVGLSERQLLRWSRDAFGYGPKLLARILRLGRALELARVGQPFADIAAQVGYADQAHLARDVRALAGVPLRELIR
jgi:AraC-like DNA-binding protein